MERHRFPRRVYGRGTEPDPRFSLANERTFLAWIRTALALLAAGVALEALEVPIEPTMRLVAGIILVVLGLAASIQAWVGWMRTETSLRENRPLPGLALGAVMAAGIVVAVLVIAVATVV